MTERDLRVGTSAGRWVLLATVLGSGLAMLDATVVNIALPTIGRDFDTGLSSLQWVVNAYTLTLAGFLLLGGALGDRFGRRKVFLIGVSWFAGASLLCAAAPNVELLILARALQGVGAALLTPGSLAILEASFAPDDRAAAIGAWSGLGGVMTAIGPFLGGWLVQSASWRWIFVINLPFALIVLWVGLRHVPETRNEQAEHGIDFAGAVLTVLGLAGVIAGLTAGPEQGWTSPVVLLPLIGGLVLLGAFVVVEQRSPHPLVPLRIFTATQFTAANIVTFVVYAALAGAFFLLPIQLQTVVDFSPIASGAALLPITIVMLFGSSRAGRLATRIGPRIPMSLGPVIAGCGLLLLTGVGAGSSYWTDVLPGVAVFGCGLVADGRAADRDGPRLRSRGVRRGRLGGEQRCRPHCGPHRDRGAASAGRDQQRGLRRSGLAERRLPDGDGHRRRHPDRGWAAGLGDDPPPGPGRDRRAAAPAHDPLRPGRTPAARRLRPGRPSGLTVPRPLGPRVRADQAPQRRRSGFTGSRRGAGRWWPTSRAPRG